MRLQGRILAGFAALLVLLTAALIAMMEWRAAAERELALNDRLAAYDRVWQLAVAAAGPEAPARVASVIEEAGNAETGDAAATLVGTGQAQLGCTASANPTIASAGAVDLSPVVVAAATAPKISAADCRLLLMLLDQVATATGAEMIVTDRRGRPVAASKGGIEMVPVATRTGIAGRVEEIAFKGATLEMTTLPLISSGHQAGYRRWVADTTEQRWGQDTGRWEVIGAAVLLTGLLAAAFAAALHRAFRPLASTLGAMKALAEGDLTVEVDGQERRDEIGDATRALKVFREGQILLKRRALGDERHRRLRLVFIQAQMEKLAATLDEANAAATRADLQRILATAARRDAQGGIDALAEAFRTMVDRVSSQNERLRNLIAAQEDALQTRSRVQRLEQELAAVSGMQARMAPPALPAGESGLVVAGRLLQGPQYGGDFYDFFWIGEEGRRRLAVLMASVRGEGLPAAFLAISARALVRAIAPQAASPGSCLSRISDLMLGDNEARLEVCAFLGVIDPVERTLVAARAACPPPYIAARPGEVRIAELEGAPPLALRPGLRVPDTTIELPVRSAIVAVSPGAAGAAAGGVPLGTEGIAGLIAQARDLDANALADALAERLAAPEITRGDASVLAVRLTAT